MPRESRFSHLSLFGTPERTMTDSPLSLKGLGRKICIPQEELKALAANAVRCYEPFNLVTGAKVRVIDNPVGRLKVAQRRIYRSLLRPLDLPWHVQGGVRGRSSLANAQAHLGKRFVVRIDLKDFFPSITDQQIYSVWAKHLGYIPAVAGLLTSLTTFRHHLPQGASTSSALANLVLLKPDSEILSAALSVGCTFSRYVDDLIISGDRPQELIDLAFRVLQRGGFKISRKKLAVMPAHTRQEATGYTVNSALGASVPRYKRDQVRAALKELEQTTQAEEFDKRAGSIRGRILHIARTNPGSARSLRKRFEDIVKQQ
jgi:RNA-directed DNA polymerase